MARRGRCRCGSVLRFEKGPNGYKTRCPSCGSVVRLRPAAAGSTIRPRRSIACPCGAMVTIPKGTAEVSCPACQRLLSVSKKSSRSSQAPKSIQASQGPPSSESAKPVRSSRVPKSGLPTHRARASEPESPRTVTCEVCHRVISAEAVRCPGCGLPLDRTTAAPGLQPDGSSVCSSTKAVVRHSIPPKLILGWAAAGASLVGVVAVILWLRH